MNLVKLKIDIRNGLIEVEADEGSFGEVMDRASLLLGQFSGIDAARPANSAPEPLARTVETTVEPTLVDPSVKSKRKRGSGGGKGPSWKMVPDLLNEQDRLDFKEFFGLKAPRTQNEQVAVIAARLKHLTNREAFSGDDIYTAFQIVGRKTPGNLSAVFANMSNEGLGHVADKKFVMNFKVDDLVNHDLPPKAVTK